MEESVLKKEKHVWRDTFICVVIALGTGPFVFPKEFETLMDQLTPAASLADISTEFINWATNLVENLLG